MTGSAIRTIIDRFLGRMDEVVEGCARAISETVPAYSRAHDGLMDDVREAVRENVETLALVLTQRRDVRPEELAAIERVGARRAEANIPLDDVLHAYRTVSRVCWDMLAEECRAHRDGDALEAAIALAEAVLRYTDQISTAVAQAYARAQHAIVREQEGARREFLADLLYGTEAEPEEILRRAHAFGYDLSLSYIALVGVAPGREGRNEAAVSSAASNAVGDVTADPIVLQKGEQIIALLPADPGADAVGVAEKMTVDLSGGWLFGMGGPDPGLDGIRRAYLEAREALEVGMALGVEGPLFLFDDLLLYHFLRSEPKLVERFVEQTLGSLLDYDARRRGELIKTLDAYFDADGSVKMAGQSLFAHPHTVTYRLKQIERLTGWSLRNSEDKLRLQLSLRALRLSNARRDPDDV